jgi:hypothetical protein
MLLGQSRSSWHSLRVLAPIPLSYRPSLACFVVLLGALRAPSAKAQTSNNEPATLAAPRAAAPPGAPRAAAASEVFPDNAALTARAPVRRRVRLHPFGIAGGLALGQGYTASAAVAAVALGLCAISARGEGACARHPTLGAFRELFIPLAGPWLSLRRDDVHADAKYVLLFGALGLAQAAGVTLIAIDLLSPRYAWVRESGLTLVPVMDARTQMLVVSARY